MSDLYSNQVAGRLRKALGAPAVGEGAPPAGGGSIPLAGWDPYSNTGGPTFCWDVPGQGWDQGSWYGQWTSLALPLMGTLDLKAGSGAASFSRPSTASYVDQDALTQTAPADTPAFDWLTLPRVNPLDGSALLGWALRCDQADALLTVPAPLNLRTTAGALTLWCRPQWAGSDTAAERIFAQAGVWKLWKPAGGTLLRFDVGQLDGSTVTVTYDIAGWAANSWHLIGASWDRNASAPDSGQIRLWTDGVLRATGATTQAYGALGTTLGIGQGGAAGHPAGAYLLDVRGWPVALNATIFTTLFALKA